MSTRTDGDGLTYRAAGVDIEAGEEAVRASGVSLFVEDKAHMAEGIARFAQCIALSRPYNKQLKQDGRLFICQNDQALPDLLANWLKQDAVEKG